MPASPVVILGARSDIGRAIAREFAQHRAPLVLGARNVASLEADRADLALRSGQEVVLAEFDVTGPDPAAFFANLPAVPSTVIMVAGLLGDQETSERDLKAASLVMDTNYAGPARYLLAAAEAMAARGSGTIVGISSVAGDRGRGSNFVYGSAKAGLSAFLSGLRNRLARRGVHVVTVKPGFVATRMTAGMKLPPLLTADPAEVARAVYAACEKRRDVVYVRPIWRLVMLVIRSIPERVFKKLSL